ncbi:MAG: PglZ domain-containing protein [Bacteroidia bacterium]|jgi:DNA-binding response OmpR family regulator
MEKTILWADDEMDLLKAHLHFLKEKGYHVITATNGSDALDIIKTKDVDLVLLDENMPGFSGLETLTKIKQIKPDLPVVMITKSEEESIMEDAIGSKISDYLLKPVNPKQILLSIKKNLDNKRLISEKTTTNYQQEFRQLGMTLGENLNVEQWKELYQKLIFWELELEKSQDESMFEILTMQKNEANTLFFKFIERNYINWVSGKDIHAPVMSHTLFKNKVAPILEENESVYFVLIDNLRYDQWKTISTLTNELFKIESEEMYYSILPTATQYARNSLFAGLMPSEIEKKYPKLWVGEEDEEGKNLHEEELLVENLRRMGKNYKVSYNKITNHNAGKKLSENLSNLNGNKLNVIVYNFVDMLSHARTEMEIIRELADNEAAYRSITKSWFEHSPLYDILKELAHKKAKVIITTDHGTIHVKEPSRVVGDKNTNSNLRYKTGRSLEFIKKDVFEVKNPADAFLPKQNISSSYIFAKEDKFFAYPNNYNHYVSYYKNTFQHGGISLEEVLIPFIVLSPK